MVHFLFKKEPENIFKHGPDYIYGKYKNGKNKLSELL